MSRKVLLCLLLLPGVADAQPRQAPPVRPDDETAALRAEVEALRKEVELLRYSLKYNPPGTKEPGVQAVSVQGVAPPVRKEARPDGLTADYLAVRKESQLSGKPMLVWVGDNPGDELHTFPPTEFLHAYLPVCPAYPERGCYVSATWEGDCDLCGKLSTRPTRAQVEACLANHKAGKQAGTIPAEPFGWSAYPVTQQRVMQYAPVVMQPVYLPPMGGYPTQGGMMRSGLFRGKVRGGGC